MKRHLIFDPAGPIQEAGRPKSFPRWVYLILEEGLPNYVAAIKADDEPTVRLRAEMVMAALRVCDILAAQTTEIERLAARIEEVAGIAAADREDWK